MLQCLTEVRYVLESRAADKAGGPGGEDSPPRSFQWCSSPKQCGWEALRDLSPRLPHHCPLRPHQYGPGRVRRPAAPVRGLHQGHAGGARLQLWWRAPEFPAPARCHQGLTLAIRQNLKGTTAIRRGRTLSFLYYMLMKLS